jgi:hypothetical protein
MSTTMPASEQLSALAAKKLLELATLPANWDTYGSPPIARAALFDALAILTSRVAASYPVPQIAPAAGGGVHLVWRLGGKELEIQTWGDRPAEYLFSVADETQSDGTLQPADGEQLRSLLGLLGDLRA